MQQHHLQDWVYVQRRRKWRFARATAAHEDERWSTRILKWKPSLRGYRSVGRPTTRWSDDLDEILGERWTDGNTVDAEMWQVLEATFLSRDV